MIYFYYYKTASMEPSSSETPETKKEKTSSTSTSPDLDKMDVEPPDRKRDSPETRTVVIAPEKKRQKIALVRRDLNFLEDFYMDHTKNMLIILDYGPHQEHAHHSGLPQLLEDWLQLHDSGDQELPGEET